MPPPPIPAPAKHAPTVDEKIMAQAAALEAARKGEPAQPVLDTVPEQEAGQEVLASEDTAPRIILYTTAPEDYDGFGARTEQIVGEVGSNGSTKTYRRVSVPDEHVQWFRNRCGSGLHNNHTEHEWWEMLGQEFFLKKFTPAPGYVMPDRPAAPVPQATGGTLLACANCGAKEATLKNCRCSMCASWWEKNHAERRVGTPGQPLPPAKQAQAVVPPPAGTKKQETAKAKKAAKATAKEEAQAAREAKKAAKAAQAAAPKEPKKIWTTDDRIAYLKDLVAQGDDAIRQAFLLRKVSICDTGQRVIAPARVFESEDQRQAVLKRLEAGEDAQALADEAGVSLVSITDLRRPRAVGGRYGSKK